MPLELLGRINNVSDRKKPKKTSPDPKKTSHAMSEETIDALFFELLMKNTGSVSKSWFLLFEKCFRFVNGKAGLISNDRSTTTFLVKSMELRGLNGLWKMLKTSPKVYFLTIIFKLNY